MGHHQVVVLGAGVNGLSTAYHLVRLGCRSVAVIDQFPFLHSRGSSHGTTRITRSTYHSADYVRLMQLVFAEEMPRWERDLGGPLSIPTPGCFYGPGDGDYPTYRASVAGFGSLVEEVSPAEARRRFPQMTFAEAQSVLIDKSCAVLLADSIMEKLLTYLARAQVTLIPDRPVTRIVPPGTRDAPIELETSAGTLSADQLIITAGGWIGRLIPAISGTFTVVRQTVGYFRAPADPLEFRAPRFPVWVSIGRDGDDYYGLPQLGQEGIKLARHDRSSAGDDPNDSSARPDADRIERLRGFAARHFTMALDEPRVEHCLYTNTADEDFVIDRLPGEPRIQIGSACSGHGFKFAPLTGRILAERAVLGWSIMDREPNIMERFSLK